MLWTLVLCGPGAPHEDIQPITWCNMNEPEVDHNGASKPDLSHHLSSEARARRPNPMKILWMLLAAQNKPGVVSLANGS